MEWYETVIIPQRTLYLYYWDLSFHLMFGSHLYVHVETGINWKAYIFITQTFAKLDNPHVIV